MVNPLIVPNDCPPLWHYTDFNALNNILKTRRFRATHFSKLNDDREIVEGSKIVLDIFNEELSNVLEKDVFQPIIDTVKYIQLRDNPTAYYIVSFTKNEDIKSHWENYSPLEEGCAIGFNHAILVKAFSGLENIYQEKDSDIIWFGKMPELSISSCIYTVEDRKKEIYDSIRKVAKNIIQGLYDDRTLSYDIKDSDKAYISAHSWDFQEFCLRIKRASFSIENEWRLVYIKDPNEDIKYDERKRQYIELKIEKDFKLSDVIPRIMISPRGNTSETKKKIEKLLTEIGELDNIEIVDSNCHYDNDGQII